MSAEVAESRSMGVIPVRNWRRLGAFLVDLITFFFVYAVVTTALTRPLEASARKALLVSIYFVLPVWALLRTLYGAFAEAGPVRRSVGKRLFRLDLLDANGRPLAPGPAAARGFVKWVLLPLAALYYLTKLVDGGPIDSLHDGVVGSRVTSRP